MPKTGASFLRWLYAVTQQFMCTTYVEPWTGNYGQQTNDSNISVHFDHL